MTPRKASGASNCLLAFWQITLVALQAEYKFCIPWKPCPLTNLDLTSPSTHCSDHVTAPQPVVEVMEDGSAYWLKIHV